MSNEFEDYVKAVVKLFVVKKRFDRVPLRAIFVVKSGFFVQKLQMSTQRRHFFFEKFPALNCAKIKELIS